MVRTLHWVLLATLLVGCGSGDADESFGGDAVLTDGTADGLGMTSAEAEAVLRVANEASYTVLDDDVRLDRRAARNIVDARQSGAIASLDELDAIPWVGVRALTRLREYVRAHDLIEADDCLIISEYIEGRTDKNKAVEIYNCGAAPLPLGDIGICLIRNDDEDCYVGTMLGDRELAAGDTLVTCRQIVGQWKNPEVWIADACEVEIGSTAIYSGDDRLALVRDTDGNDELSVEADEVLDVLGRITFRPTWSPWNDVRLERCRLEPNDGRSFYRTEDWFTTHGWSLGAGASLGEPPEGGCP